MLGNKEFASLNLGNTYIEDTFAEAFGMRYTRLIITGQDSHWLQAAVQEVTGYSASVIACDAEAGVDRWLSESETPDGRPGVAVLLFGFSEGALTKSVVNRVGQCVMTCPTTAVFDGLPTGIARLPLGKNLRYFGDGFQKSKLIDSVRYWRIPVMDGEFLVQEDAGVGKGVAGGNLIIQGCRQLPTLAAARKAAEAIAAMPGVILPFPGGVVRSGSKVGSRYAKLPASTADAYCPTLRGRVTSQLHPEAQCVYEIVIDGISEEAVAAAMKTGLEQAATEDVLVIGAGNYGGKLGKFHFHLRELLGSPALSD